MFPAWLMGDNGGLIVIRSSADLMWETERKLMTEILSAGKTSLLQFLFLSFFPLSLHVLSFLSLLLLSSFAFPLFLLLQLHLLIPYPLTHSLRLLYTSPLLFAHFSHTSNINQFSFDFLPFFFSSFCLFNPIYLHFLIFITLTLFFLSPSFSFITSICISFFCLIFPSFLPSPLLLIFPFSLCSCFSSLFCIPFHSLFIAHTFSLSFTSFPPSPLHLFLSSPTSLLYLSL